MFQETDDIKLFLNPTLSLFMLLPITFVAKPIAPFYFSWLSTFDMRKNGLIEFGPFFFLKQSLDKEALKATAK